MRKLLKEHNRLDKDDFMDFDQAIVDGEEKGYSMKRPPEQYPGG